jgi:hypothetical protein
MCHGEHLEKTISDAGFTDVKVKKVNILFGDWEQGLRNEWDGL